MDANRMLQQLLNDDPEEEENSEESLELDNETMGNNVSNVNNYDATLPARHSYLGGDMEELNGRTILEEGEEVTIALLVYPHVVLVPGQKLPIQLLHPPVISMMHNVIENNRIFGLINHSDQHPLSVEGRVGTTAEVRYFKEDEDGDSGVVTLSVLADGSQRFVVKKSWRNSQGILFGSVKILEEVVAGECLEGASLPSLQRFKNKPHNFQPARQNEANCVDNEGTPGLNRRKYDWRTYCHSTWWPWWIYEQYDVSSLMQKIKVEIEDWNKHLPLDTSPEDPVKFSYWVAANIPINDALKVKLISLDSAVRRLRAELNILKSFQQLKCRDCHEPIAERKDVFSMSAEGPQGTYVNPNGYVHETLTVYAASGVELIGRASTQHSWFPGYAWIIAQCRRCRNHMGWKFVATKKGQRPAYFWGICRSSVQSGLETAMEDPSSDILV